MPKLITKGRLIAAMETGRVEGYNHQVDEATINSLDPAHHYPVLTAIPHRHKHGRESEPHVRVLVEVVTRAGREMVLVDMPEGMYEGLPEARQD
jgi:hypothetical protein